MPTSALVNDFVTENTSWAVSGVVSFQYHSPTRRPWRTTAKQLLSHSPSRGERHLVEHRRVEPDLLGRRSVPLVAGERRWPACVAAVAPVPAANSGNGHETGDGRAEAGHGKGAHGYRQ